MRGSSIQRNKYSWRWTHWPHLSTLPPALLFHSESTLSSTVHQLEKHPDKAISPENAPTCFVTTTFSCDKVDDFTEVQRQRPRPQVCPSPLEFWEMNLSIHICIRGSLHPMPKIPYTDLGRYELLFVCHPLSWPRSLSLPGKNALGNLSQPLIQDFSTSGLLTFWAG